MRDAIGGIPNLVIIVVFLVLVSGYMAFNVNYTKAFRVKNKIISAFEEYEGKCDVNDTCKNDIKNYMKSLGYESLDFSIEGYNCEHGYCYKKFDVANTSSAADDVQDYTNTVYFNIVTQIRIDLPIINKIMPNLLQVSGNTKPIEVNW